MAKNALVITGSPRKSGNSNQLAEALMNGARAAGCEVTRFDAAADPVKPCVACDACWSRGTACVFGDGLDRLAPMLEQADTLVLASPLYWATFSGQLKTALDKFHAFLMPSAPRKLKLTEAALLMCAANPDPRAFAGAVASYKIIADFLGLTDRGQLLVPGVQAAGAIRGTDALARAEQLGRALA